MKRLTICLLVVSAFPVFAVAQEKSVRPGINKPFSSPDVVAFVERFEREGREVYDFRQEIVDNCRLRPGMVVADIGAGTGLFTRMLAPRVGPTGQVYAVDISKDFVEHVTKSCQKNGWKHVKGVVCTATSAELPDNSIDLVFICDTYHHFEFPYRTIRSIRRALRPNGSIVLVEYHREKGKSTDWIMNHVRAGKETFQREIELAGFEVAEDKDFMVQSYWLRFRKADRTTSRGHTTDSIADVKRLLTDGTAALIDVREPGEWDGGHLREASLVPLSEIQAGTKSDKLSKSLAIKLPKTKIIYFHCRSGGRVLIATDLLKTYGYDIRPLRSGFSSLVQEGFEEAR
jgi:ubiquinone/menaquinone biosynthesis C-methylase UbiE/rhodanese-related sulfurtransferase